MQLLQYAIYCSCGSRLIQRYGSTIRYCKFISIACRSILFHVVFVVQVVLLWRIPKQVESWKMWVYHAPSVIHSHCSWFWGQFYNHTDLNDTHYYYFIQEKEQGTYVYSILLNVHVPKSIDLNPSDWLYNQHRLWTTV
jgi:hypothetical protein